MVGILKNNKVIRIILIFCLLTSCKHKVKNQEDFIKEDFIKENFINIVDTIAYNYGSFRALPPLPNDTTNKIHNYFNLSIKLNDSIHYESVLQKEIDNFFNLNEKLKIQFKVVLEEENYSNLKLTSKFPNKIGKYHIFLNKVYEDKKIKYAGEVQISNFKITENKAFLIVIKSFQNSMIAYIVIFIKEDNNWKVIKREPLFES